MLTKVLSHVPARSAVICKGKGSVVCRVPYYELPIPKALRYGMC